MIRLVGLPKPSHAPQLKPECIGIIRVTNGPWLALEGNEVTDVDSAR